MIPFRNSILVAGVALVLGVGPLLALGEGAATQGDPAEQTQIEAIAQQAPVLLIAKVEAVKTDDQVEGVGPSVIMDVTLNGPVLLKGNPPENLTLPYRVEPERGFVPQKGQAVLAAISNVLVGPIIGGPPMLPGQPRPMPASEWRIVLLAPATAENIAAANGGVAHSPEGRLKAAVGAADLVFVATADKVIAVGRVQPTLLKVTVEDLNMLKGEKPTILDCPYPLPPASPALFRPWAGDRVLIAAHVQPSEAGAPADTSGRHSGPLPVLGGNGPPIFFMTNATDENIALARKAVAGPTSQSTTAPGTIHVIRDSGRVP